MERDWTYQDASGTEHGPYTWEELVRYAGENRIDPECLVRCGTQPWMSPADAGVFEGTPRPQAPPANPFDNSKDAIDAADSAHRSPHNRLLYLLLGILLPLITGLAGINNLLVGRTGQGLIQLMLCLFNFVLILLGFVVGVTFCLALPLGAGIMLWSVIEAATNDKDGDGRTMMFS